MKIIEKQNLVKIEGDVEVQKFDFIFNAKMVQMLSDSLYNDKILAIVRELSTNALDSHRDNGNPSEPFRVHLPCWNEMWFSIRDFGTGMSADRVDNIYRKYGGSDRTDSNDYTGGMGLGSKTPFCYHTKTFEINVWYNGTKTTYSAYIGEDGIPEIAKMAEVPSSERSGVEIKLPVKQYDEQNFKRAAEKIYPYFETKPEIHGGDCTIKPIEYILTSDTGLWKLRKNDSNGCRLVMGDVAYPVKFDDTNITSAQRNVMSSCFDIFADIGSVSVDIGREGLSYDNRTKTRVRYFINEIVSDFNAKIEKEIKGCKNLWEARKKAAQLHRATEVKVSDPKKMEYKGTKLFTELNNTVELTKFIKDGRLSVLSFTNDSWRQKYEKRRINSISVTQAQLFYTNDLKIGSFVRAGAEAKKHGCTIVLFKFEDDAAKADVLKHIGCDESYFTDISTIPSPTVRGSSGARGNIGRVLTFDQSRHKSAANKSSFWETVKDEIDFDEDEGVYLEFNRFSFRNEDGDLDEPTVITNLVTLCKDSGIKVPTIYGIKTADMGKIKDNPDWVNFYDWLRGAIAAKLKNHDMAEIEFYHGQYGKVCRNGGFYSRDNYLSHDVLRKIVKHCNKDTIFTQFVKKVDQAGDYTQKYNEAYSLKNLADRFKIKPSKIFTPPADFVLDKMQDQVYTKYKLLGFLNTGYLDGRAGYLKVAEYIDMIG